MKKIEQPQLDQSDPGTDDLEIIKKVISSQKQEKILRQLITQETPCMQITLYPDAKQVSKKGYHFKYSELLSILFYRLSKFGKVDIQITKSMLKTVNLKSFQIEQFFPILNSISVSQAVKGLSARFEKLYFSAKFSGKSDSIETIAFMTLLMDFFRILEQLLEPSANLKFQTFKIHSGQFELQDIESQQKQLHLRIFEMMKKQQLVCYGLNFDISGQNNLPSLLLMQDSPKNEEELSQKVFSTFTNITLEFSNEASVYQLIPPLSKSLSLYPHLKALNLVFSGSLLQMSIEILNDLLEAASKSNMLLERLQFKNIEFSRSHRENQQAFLERLQLLKQSCPYLCLFTCEISRVSEQQFRKMTNQELKQYEGFNTQLQNFQKLLNARGSNIQTYINNIKVLEAVGFEYETVLGVLSKIRPSIF